MTDRELVARAAEFRSRAYAPYSGFAVGAALLGRSGRIYGGVNVENAAYPVADSPEACAPCGMCRQMLMEFPIERIILANTAGDLRVLAPEELLPLAFGAAALPHEGDLQ